MRRKVLVTFRRYGETYKAATTVRVPLARPLIERERVIPMSVTSASRRARDQAASPADSAAILRAGYATVATMTVLALVRGALGAVWFTETLWKLPWKNYGCPADFTLARSGLCDWIGREIANPPFGLYHSFLVNLIGPNIRFVGFGVWLAETAVALLLLLGLFTRLGGLLGT